MPRFRTIVVLGALAGVAGTARGAEPATRPAAATQPSAEAVFQEGRDALYRGEYERAVGLLRKASEADLGKTSYRVHLARALQYAGRAGEAEKVLAGVLKSNPDHVEAGQLLGEIYFKQENWKAVVGVLEPLLKYRHDYPTYHLLAEAKYSLNDLEAAKRYYQEAVRLNAQNPADHYQLGNIHLAGNAFALAAEAYQTALRLGLRSPVLHYKLASAYFNLRNYFGPITVAEVKSGKAGMIHEEYYLVEAVPGKPSTFRVAASSSAIYHVAKAIEGAGSTDRPDLQLLRANIYLNAGRYEQAHALFKQLEPSVPAADRALFYYYYAQAAFGKSAYEDYLRLLGEAIKLDKETYKPTLVDAYLRVAELYNSAGDLDAYIAYLTKAVGESPQTASLHLRLGHALQEAGKYPAAVIQWRMVLDLEPDHPQRLEILNLIGKYGRTPVPGTNPATRAG